MADSTNAPKPSSSVKLVLLGEAAVGKVRTSPVLGALSLRLEELQRLTDSSIVFSRTSLRQQRLPREQRADDWRSVASRSIPTLGHGVLTAITSRFSYAKMPAPGPNDQV